MRDIRDEGGQATFFKADVTSELDARKMVDTPVAEFGRLDILKCNSAVQIEKTVPETIEEEWDRVINLNLKGCFLCAKHAISQMKQQRSGNIIVISSLSGLVSNAKQSSYNASKHGVINPSPPGHPRMPTWNQIFYQAGVWTVLDPISRPEILPWLKQ